MFPKSVGSWNRAYIKNVFNYVRPGGKQSAIDENFNPQNLKNTSLLHSLKLFHNDNPPRVTTDMIACGLENKPKDV